MEAVEIFVCISFQDALDVPKTYLNIIKFYINEKM